MPGGFGYSVFNSVQKPKIDCALFLTNIVFNDTRTAKNSLCLTYTPRFRNIPLEYENDKNRIINPVFISDGITLRTCPAFGSNGGAGEWIIELKQNDIICLETQDYFVNGGCTDRWYMSGWERNLLTSSVFLMKISEVLMEVLPFDEEEVSEIRATLRGYRFEIVFRLAESIKKNNTINCEYISISCGFQQSRDGFYVKYWGERWRDIFVNKSLDYRTIKNVTPSSTRQKTSEEKFTIEYCRNNFEYSGLRFITKSMELGEIYYKNSINISTLEKHINSTITWMKKFLQMKKTQPAKYPYYSDRLKPYFISQKHQIIPLIDLSRNLWM